MVEMQKFGGKEPAAQSAHDPRQLSFQEFQRQVTYTNWTSSGCENQVRFGCLRGKPVCLKLPVDSGIDDKGRDFTQDPSAYVRNCVRLFDLLKAHNFRVPEIIHWDASTTGTSYIACADLTENNEWVFVDSKRNYNNLIVVAGQSVRGRDHLAGLKNWHELQLILQAEDLRAAAYGFNFGVSPYACVRTKDGVGEVWIHDVGEGSYNSTIPAARLKKLQSAFESHGKKLGVDPVVTRYLAAVTMAFIACTSLATVAEKRELVVFKELQRKKPGTTPKLFNFYRIVFQAITEKLVPDTSEVWGLIEFSRRIVFRDLADGLGLTRDTLIDVRKVIDLPFRTRGTFEGEIELVLRLPWIEAVSVLQQDPHKKMFDPSHIVGVAPAPRLVKQQGEFGYTYKSGRAQKVLNGEIVQITSAWATDLVWRRPHGEQILLQTVPNSA
jgi:hypothetical protein